LARTDSLSSTSDPDTGTFYVIDEIYFAIKLTAPVNWPVLPAR
jgi:hypothetical protein